MEYVIGNPTGLQVSSKSFNKSRKVMRKPKTLKFTQKDLLSYFSNSNKPTIEEISKNYEEKDETANSINNFSITDHFDNPPISNLNNFNQSNEYKVIKKTHTSKNNLSNDRCNIILEKSQMLLNILSFVIRNARKLGFPNLKLIRKNTIKCLKNENLYLSIYNMINKYKKVINDNTGINNKDNDIKMEILIKNIINLVYETDKY